MKTKLLFAIVVSIASYAIFLYIIFGIFPNIGKAFLPFLLMWHLLSIFLMYKAYRRETFKVPIIGDFAAKWSKIDDTDQNTYKNKIHIRNKK